MQITVTFSWLQKNKPKSLMCATHSDLCDALTSFDQRPRSTFSTRRLGNTAAACHAWSLLSKQRGAWWAWGADYLLPANRQTHSHTQVIITQAALPPGSTCGWEELNPAETVTPTCQMPCSSDKERRQQFTTTTFGGAPPTGTSVRVSTYS